MKLFFKWLFYLLLIGVGIYFGNQGLNSWQAYRDAKAIIGTPQGQLPEWAEPIEYDLNLTIDPSQSDFSGQVLIDVKLSQATDVVWLHGKNFNIEKAQWMGQSKQWQRGEFLEVGHSGVMQFELGQMIEPQTIQLKINFSREFSDDLSGLYQVKRKNGADVFTQFEATDARKAFPSFDEPRFKTPFTFHLKVPSNRQAFANTPEVQRSHSDGWSIIDYLKSKPLPTYLVAFAVGEFDVIDGGEIAPNMYREHSIPFRAIAVKGKGDKLGYAIKHTESIVSALEEYFGQAYPYEKLDIVAVPDFAAGAMENAGLITYREQLLLIGDSPTISEQQSYYRVHSHELAHQWFGNLVTMPWWDDIWLNESFANWMEGKVVAKLRPDFRSQEGEIKSVHRVMDADALVASRQVREPIKSNGDIENAFDGITYTKGGGVLNMFENYLGEELFRKGVQFHLSRFAWGNATAPDFIESMAHATQQPDLVHAFLSFIEQPGVPLLEVEWQCDMLDPRVTTNSSSTDANQDRLPNTTNDLVIHINQSRYFPLGSLGDSNQTWKIPMCISAISDQREDFCFILQSQKTVQRFKVNQCPSVVSLNKDASGYYRWNIGEHQWDDLIAQVQKLNSLERISLRSNLFASVAAGKSKPEKLINSAAAFVQLDDFESKFLPMGSLENLAKVFATEQEKQRMNVYLKSLYGQYLDELGFDANTELDKSDPALASSVRRNLVQLFAQTLRDANLRQALIDNAKHYVGYEGDNLIHEDAMNPELVAVALQVAVQDLGIDFYNHLEKKLAETEDGKTRGRILSGMSATQEPELSERVLGMVVSTDTRMNEKFIMIGGQLTMEETQDRTYEWFKNKYSILSLFLPEQYLSYAPMIGSGFCSKEQLADMQEFFKDEIKPGSGAERHMAKVTEMITNCSTIKSSITSLDIPTEIASEKVNSGDGILIK